MSAFTKAGGGQYVSRMYRSNHYNWHKHYGADHVTQPPHVDRPDYESPTYGGTTSSNTTTDQPMACTGFGETEARITFITNDHRVSYNNRPYEGVGRIQADGSALNNNIEQKDNYYVQFIGRSLQTSKPLYLYNNIDTEYTQYIEQFNVGSDNCTQLHLFNAAPTTTGTLYGGARGYSTIGKTANWASKHFYKPATAILRFFIFHTLMLTMIIIHGYLNGIRQMIHSQDYKQLILPVMHLQLICQVNITNLEITQRLHRVLLTKHL